MTQQPIYKILIIDDSRTSTEVLRNFIRPLGYETISANSGEEALEILANTKPDLILLDVMMPGMDGFETCSAIKQTDHHDVPIIFVTTQTEMDSLAKGFEVGGVDYITKPAKPTEIQAKIKTHLQLRQANHDLYCMNLNKDRFFSIVAKDLSDPLTTIFSATNMLVESMETLNKGEMKGLLDGVHKASGILLKQLENLLEWSLLQTGQLPCEPTTISTQQLISHCFERMQTLATKKNIQLINTNQHNYFIYADLHMIENTLLNLLSNAIRFSPVNTQVNISASQLNEHIQITVADTGLGMDQTTLDKLFRLDALSVSEDTQQNKGSGLGLILCKAFIERNHGDISVHSKLNQGTTLTVNLPRVEP